MDSLKDWESIFAFSTTNCKPVWPLQFKKLKVKSNSLSPEFIIVFKVPVVNSLATAEKFKDPKTGNMAHLPYGYMLPNPYKSCLSILNANSKDCKCAI